MEMGIFAYMRWLTEKGVEFELAYPRLSELGYRAASGNKLPAGFEEQMKQDTLVFFRHLVAQGKNQGDIAPEIDEDLAAFLLNTIFSNLGRYLMQRVAALDYQPGSSPALYEFSEAQDLLTQTYNILENGLTNYQER